MTDSEKLDLIVDKINSMWSEMSSISDKLNSLELHIKNVTDKNIQTFINVNFKLDKRTKEDMEAVCAELGMSMETAFNIFARKVAREHRIPFEISVDPSYNRDNKTEDKQDKR